MQAYQKLISTLTASGQQSFSVVGDAVFLIAAAGTLTIEAEGTPETPIPAGTGIRIKNAQFTRLTVRDTSGAANAFSLLAGFFDILNAGSGGGAISGLVSVTLPQASTAAIVQMQTSAAGANFSAFAALACKTLEVVNDSGVDVEYRRGGAGVALPVYAGTSRLIVGITDAAQISVRRIDQTNTQIFVKAEAFA